MVLWCTQQHDLKTGVCCWISVLLLKIYRVELCMITIYMVQFEIYLSSHNGLQWNLMMLRRLF